METKIYRPFGMYSCHDMHFHASASERMTPPPPTSRYASVSLNHDPSESGGANVLDILHGPALLISLLSLYISFPGFLPSPALLLPPTRPLPWILACPSPSARRLPLSPRRHHRHFPFHLHASGLLFTSRPGPSLLLFAVIISFHSVVNKTKLKP